MGITKDLHLLLKDFHGSLLGHNWHHTIRALRRVIPFSLPATFSWIKPTPFLLVAYLFTAHIFSTWSVLGVTTFFCVSWICVSWMPGRQRRKKILSQLVVEKWWFTIVVPSPYKKNKKNTWNPKWWPRLCFVFRMEKKSGLLLLEGSLRRLQLNKGNFAASHLRRNPPSNARYLIPVLTKRELSFTCTRCTRLLKQVPSLKLTLNAAENGWDRKMIHLAILWYFTVISLTFHRDLGEIGRSCEVAS